MNIEPSLKELMVKTQCPHCQAKFKSPDEHKGKKVKCPKCSQSFVITPFVEKTSVEICSSCGRQLDKSEKAYVVKGGLICTECDRKASGNEKDSPSTEAGQAIEEVEHVAVPPPKSVKTSKWLPFSQSSKAGIIFSVILIILGIKTLFEKEPEPRGFIVDSSRPYLLEKGGSFLIIVSGLCILVRAFLPGQRFWRIVCILLGAPIATICGALFVWGSVMLISGGRPAAWAGMSLVCLPLLVISVFLLKWGFETS